VPPAMPPLPLDLVHQREPIHHTVAGYLFPQHATLIDCAAAASLPSLESELARHGTSVAELEHLLLTHIHLDHAGAAGALAARNPRLQVWVHRVGARHLIDPSRLIASTASVYGADFEQVWGPILPVPADRVHVIEDELRLPAATGGMLAVPTPGHARHHVAYLGDDGTLYAGDAAGAAWPGSAGYAEPSCPPPDADPPAWRRTFARIGELAPDRLAIAHFGVIEDVPRHMAALSDLLDVWLERLDRSEDAFAAAVHEDRRHHAGAAPAGFWGHVSVERWCHAGLRFWRQRLEAAPAG
jgi:glyoxylase-like metal-dependent hydrolase (beta-lactamase superfamily II)